RRAAPGREAWAPAGDGTSKGEHADSTGPLHGLLPRPAGPASRSRLSPSHPCSTTTFLGSRKIFLTASASLNLAQNTSEASSGERHSVNFMLSMAVALGTG